MFALTVVVSILLALAVTGSAVGKLIRAAPVMASMREVRVTVARVPAFAGVEIVGAVGLLVGLAVPVIGILATMVLRAATARARLCRGVTCYLLPATCYFAGRAH